MNSNQTIVVSPNTVTLKCSNRPGARKAPGLSRPLRRPVYDPCGCCEPPAPEPEKISAYYRGPVDPYGWLFMPPPPPHRHKHRHEPCGPLARPPMPHGCQTPVRGGQIVTTPGGAFLPYASKTKLGAVKIGDGISVDNKGVISVSAEDILNTVGYAGNDNLGLVKIGEGITVTEDGEISVTADNIRDTVGSATNTNEGVVKLSDSTNAPQLDATSGVAATPAAVTAVKKALEAVIDSPSVLLDNLSEAELRKFTKLLLQEGGGLAVDENGNIYVDFSLMPTDKFEALLKQIRVPIWIDSSTTQWYVDGTNGSDDTSDSGRGKSKEMPFKTIQACVNYITENYNIGAYEVDINVAAGTYNESVVLGAQNRTSGYICLRPYNEADEVKIRREGFHSLLYIQDGVYRIQNIKLEIIANGQSDIHVECNGIYITDNANVYINNMNFSIIDNTGVHSNPIDVRAVIVNNNGVLMVETGCSINATKNGTASISAFYCRYGKVILSSSPYIVPTFIINGSFTHVLISDGGYIERNEYYGLDHRMVFTGNATGIKYLVSNGGALRWGGDQGIPGSIDGSVDAGSYSWRQ